MAIVNNGTKNSLPNSLIPDGYTRPVVTDFTDYQYTQELTLNVLRVTVANSDKAVTMTNVINDAAIGITKQVDDILAADFLATATVTAFADLTVINNNIPPSNASDFYSDAVVNYVCKVTLFVKAL